MRENSGDPILIAGAGIGGLTTAYALRQKGFDVALYEQADSPVMEPGVGLRLWSNATSLLSQLGLRDQLRDMGMAIEKVQIRASNGLLLSENPIHFLAKQVGTPSIGIRHDALMHLLLDACRDIPVHYGQRCEGYTSHDDCFFLRLADRSEVPGRLIIGADGFQSAIRAQLVGDGAPSYTGHTMWQGISEGWGGLEQGTMYTVWGAGNLHAGCWYIAENQVAWFIRIDAPANQQESSDTVKAHLLDLLKGVRGPLHQVVQHTPAEQICHHDIYRHAHIDFARLIPVVLVGDAAHSMPNILGQTVSQTIEDGVVLAQSLTDSVDVMDSLALYEKRRKPRVQWVRGQIDRFDTIDEANRPALFWLKTKAAQLLARDSSAHMWQQFVSVPNEL